MSDKQQEQEQQHAYARAIDEREQEQFAELLRGLTASDNEQRQRCEQVFERMKRDEFEILTRQLLRQLRNEDRSEKSRSNAEMAAVLIRRNIGTNNDAGEFKMGKLLSEAGLEAMKAELLKALEEDSIAVDRDERDQQSKSIVNKTRDVVIEIAASDIDRGDRDEVEGNCFVHIRGVIERFRGALETTLRDFTFNFASEFAARE
jgi:hypothetical protein